jgi:hypothetical protein
LEQQVLLVQEQETEEQEELLKLFQYHLQVAVEPVQEKIQD